MQDDGKTWQQFIENLVQDKDKEERKITKP